MHVFFLNGEAAAAGVVVGSELKATGDPLSTVLQM